MEKAADFNRQHQSNHSSPGQGPATTAIGILCRMQQGRKRDVEARRALQDVPGKSATSWNARRATPQGHVTPLRAAKSTIS